MDVRLFSVLRRAGENSFTDERKRVVLIPRRWDQALRDVSQGDDGYKARYTGESAL